MKQIFLNERIVLSVIIVNALIIFAQECGAEFPLLDVADLACTLYFIAEIIVKIKHLGWRKFCRDGWNVFDFIIVLVSLPSALQMALPALGSFETLQTLRTLRIVKFMRTFRFFPDFAIIVGHFRDAMRKTVGIMCSFLLLIVITALICTDLLHSIVPQYFGSIGESIYTIFRMCTIEGWYDIPNTIAEATTPFWGGVAKIVFSLILIMGGIIGLSLINSIFVDEMVSDNNNDIRAQLNRIEEELKRLSNK